MAGDVVGAGGAHDTEGAASHTAVEPWPGSSGGGRRSWDLGSHQEIFQIF